MDSYDVLVIILSVTLAIFLVLAIIVMIMMMIVLKKFKKVAKSAEQIAQNVESFSSSLLNTSGLVNVIQTFYRLINGITRKERSK